MAELGSGYMHFPIKYDDEYFAQLTAEKATVKYSRSFPHRVWVKTRARNEALDYRVYAMAALAILSPHYKKISEHILKVSKHTKEIDSKSAKQNISNIRKKKNNWMYDWRRY